MKNIFKKIKYFTAHPIVRYYLNHPVVLLKNRIIVVQLWLKKTMNKDVNFNDKIFSTLPIDVVLVSIEKDFDVLIHVVESIKKNIKHPIGKIIIISPKSNLIINLCKKLKCMFIDENSVLPIIRKDIKYAVEGIDRSGWLFQQLLKWSGDKYVKNDYFLIADADTVFCRPQIFVHNGKVILPVSSQLCHIPYFKAYKKLTGRGIEPLVNFTSHHSLFHKSKLKRLKKEIERHCNQKWYEAIISNIDQKEGSFVSDYETYGQFVYLNYPHEFILEHWFNLSLSRKRVNELPGLMNKFGQDYKAISFHTYNNRKNL